MSRHHQGLNRKRWERVRISVLDAANWRCSACGGYANEVDHIQPLNKGGSAFDLTNLQVLCADCHIEKTRQENGRELTPAELEWQDFVRELSR